MKCMSVSVVRNTFRMDDNPFLDSDLILIPLDLSRFPMVDWREESVFSNRWSMHQCWLMLHVIREFCHSVLVSGGKVEVLTFESLDELKASLKKHVACAKVLVDRMLDPAYEGMDETIDSVFSSSTLTRIETQTLVSWSDNENCFRRHLKRVKSVYSSTNSLKKDICDVMRRPHESKVKRKTSKADAVPLVQVKRMIRDLRDAASNSDVFLYEFDSFYGVCTGKFDELLKEYMERYLQGMKSASWKKPSTAANTSLTRFCDAKGLLNTSKLSPFLSVGALSPIRLYEFLSPVEHTDERGYTPMSARDQLLFREAFYAYASFDPQKLSFWSDTSGWWDPKLDYKAKNPLETIKRADSTLQWKDAPEKVLNWAEGTMPKDWHSSNESMHILEREGWIHHLRRHLVADVLCRGRLKQHFLYGEAWFRRTEIDHDAVINRANWLWLSGNAFSSKQKAGYHYGKNFIHKKSANCDVPLRPLLGTT